MSGGVNVDAYFERIDYRGGRAPTLQTLQDIVRHHTETIAFENLTPLSRRPVLLDIESLQRKIVEQQRGGYCFEQNLLLGSVLRQLGYGVTGLAARVMWNLPETKVLPRTHMAMLVDVNGQDHLVDVGFGGLTLTGVLELRAGIEQPTPHETFRIVAAGTHFVMQASVRSEWRPLYQFDLQEQTLADYEMANWYSSTHPSSRFVGDLIAGRAAPGKRYALLNKALAIHHRDGGTERRTLSGAGELRETLERDFLLRVPNTPEAEAALERVAAMA